MGFTDRLRDLFGGGSREKSSSRRRPSEGMTIGELPLSLQMQRIAAVTPQQLSAILRLADLGYMYQLADLANEARQKDGHLQSILGTREMCAASLDWEIVPHDDGKRLRDRKIAEWLTEAIKAADGSSSQDGEEEALVGFRGLVSNMAGGCYYGYSVDETVYGKDRGKLCPVGWSHIAARRIAFSQFSGRICWWDQTGGKPYPGVDLRSEFTRGKILIHQPRINGDVQVREGLARVLMWGAMFRVSDLRDWLALGELAWKPWRIAKYKKGGDPNADKAEINSILSLMSRMTTSGFLGVPDTVDVSVEWPKGGKQGASHAELFAVLGAEMSKAVLGQTLTTEQGSKGSQALGRVHDGVRKDIKEFDARSIAETIRRDLIAPLVRMNFGNDADIPIFRFITTETEDMGSFAAGVSTLKSAGLRIPAAWVRDRVGMPQPDDDDEILGEPDGDEEDIPIDPATGLPTVPAEPANTEPAVATEPPDAPTSED